MLMGRVQRKDDEEEKENSAGVLVVCTPPWAKYFYLTTDVGR